MRPLLFVSVRLNCYDSIIMVHELLAAVSQWVLQVINNLGYFGVFFLMALESANIPIPSEIIMPFSGFLVTQNGFNFWAVVFWGAFGNLAGSLVSYFIALRFGRRAIIFMSRYLFICREDLDIAEEWFLKHGSWSVFLGRIVPVIRTFISFPAGMFKVGLGRFVVLTFAGSFIWSVFLTYVGYVLGENWEILGPYFRKFDYVIVAIIVIGAVWWVWRHVKRSQKLKVKSDEI